MTRSALPLRTLLWLAAGLVLAGPAWAAKKPPPPPPVSPALVAQAERDFAADGLAMGVKQSFLKHMDDQAVVFQPEPRNAREAIGAQPDAPGPTLEWWPTWAGIARSGDLGFTTGPYAVNGVRRGHYLTVWKRQADGGWKWVYDGGTGSSSKLAPGPDQATAFLPMSSVAIDDPAGAGSLVGEADAALNAAAAEDVTAAYLAALVCEARLQGSSAPPAQGCASFKAELATRARDITFTTLGGEASAAGDMAWTYGEADWTRDGQAGHGHYVRIWQVRADGWRLVFDQLLPAPPRKAA
ncbi:MAG: DUF4440 domain-containing protein [Caulobacter sp.]|nr:DUF4440 domain-containing protein [Caulobacter sp.]